MNINKLSEERRQEMLETAKRLYNDNFTVNGVAAILHVSKFTARKLKKIIENT